MSKNKIIGIALAFAGGFCAALAIVAGDGIVIGEVFQALSAGFTTSLGYAKAPAK